jgi:hypothetical protein
VLSDPIQSKRSAKSYPDAVNLLRANFRHHIQNSDFEVGTLFPDDVAMSRKAIADLKNNVVRLPLYVIN